MSNKKIINEAERIANELIAIQKSKYDLDKLFNKIINKEFKTNSINVLFYLTNILAEKNYSIESFSPFELKKNNF